jgi:hypothetical protein
VLPKILAERRKEAEQVLERLSGGARMVLATNEMVELGCIVILIRRVLG